MENASIHKSPSVMEFIQTSKLPVLFSGVSSCDSASVEVIIGLIKRRFLHKSYQRIALQPGQTRKKGEIIQQIVWGANDIPADIIRRTFYYSIKT